MLQIDKDLCIGCGICEDQCAFGAIHVADGTAVVGDACTLCGACVDACEVNALAISGMEKSVQMNLADWSGVWVYCEFRRGGLASVSLELLGIGRKLADERGVPLSAVLLGSETGDTAAQIIGHGADTVYRADDRALALFADDVYGAVMTSLIREHRPEIVLAGATAIGRSFIPGVATLLHTGLTADCTKLEIRPEDGALLQTRPAFGGNIMATIECPSTRPQMATVRPRVMKALEFDSRRTGTIVDVRPSADQLQSRIEVMESVVSPGPKVNIQESDILVSGGRGLDSEKGFALIEQLAKALNGDVSASRAAVDAGWIPYPHQVGQTRKDRCPEAVYCLRNIRCDSACRRYAIVRHDRCHQQGQECPYFRCGRFRDCRRPV